jgi:hypothetical protein
MPPPPGAPASLAPGQTASPLPPGPLQPGQPMPGDPGAQLPPGAPAPGDPGAPLQFQPGQPLPGVAGTPPPEAQVQPGQLGAPLPPEALPAGANGQPQAVAPACAPHCSPSDLAAAVPGLGDDANWQRTQSELGSATSAADRVRLALAAAALLSQHGAPQLGAQVLANAANDLSQNVQQVVASGQADPGQAQQLSDLGNLQQQLANAQSQLGPDPSTTTVVTDPGAQPAIAEAPGTGANAPADASQAAD